MIGFQGVPVSSKEMGDARHSLILTTCRFPDGTEEMYVVAHDVHDGGGTPRMLPLSTVVHLIQNVTDEERWDIECREQAASKD